MKHFVCILRLVVVLTILASCNWADQQTIEIKFDEVETRAC